MAEFDRARVWSHMYRGPFRFSVLAANTSTIIGGTQQMVKTPVAIASVQVTRTSMRIVSFIETGRAVSCFVVFLRWSKTTKTRKWKKKILKSLKAKIKNPKDNMKEEAGGIIKDNTEARIGMDHDTMSITLSPRFSMKILLRSGNPTAAKRSRLIVAKWMIEVWHERLT